MRPDRALEEAYDILAVNERRICERMHETKQYPVTMGGLMKIYRVALKEIHKRMRFLDVRLAEYLAEDAWCEQEPGGVTVECERC